MRFGVIGVLLTVVVGPALAGHDKSDTVTFSDGSTYIGEIKSVKYSTLNLNTDPAGLVSIEWRHVKSLVSKFEYRIELAGGTVRYGSLGKTDTTDHLSIVDASGATEVPLADVVAMVPIEHGFWKRVDGSVDFGLSYTQTNNAFQYNLGGDATYRTRRTYGSLSGQSIFNTQDGGESTNQHNLDLTLVQFGKKKWSSFELGGLQSNPDQGYDLRSLLGGGAVYPFIESGKKLFVMNLGAVYNREQVTDSPEVDNSAEVLLGVAFRRFKLGSHSPSLQVGLQTFTNVTNTPRFRAVFDFNVSWKVIGDFKFSVQIRNSYDTNPPGEGAKKNDLSFVTSAGYTF